MTLPLVNMTPLSFSGETNQDSEPNLAVNPAHPEIIAASAFTPDADPEATHAPIYVSMDGGKTWSLRSIVPYCQGITADITLRFSSTSNRLYVGYLQTNGLGADLAVARTDDMSLASPMELISKVTSGDQPYIQAATVPTGPDKGKDRVYVGFSDGWAQMHLSLDAGISLPTFTTVRLESRDFQDGVSYDLPQVRTAVHPSGVVYAAFHSVRVGGSPHKVDVVVVRDDQWGSGASPFTDLKAPTDGKPGQYVVQGVEISNAAFGQEAGEGELSVAADPTNASVVYIAWADMQSTGYTLHVRRSKNSGQTWPDELWTIPMAQNPALAVNSVGTVGFLFQRFKDGPEPRWETYFCYRKPDGIGEQLLLATVPADTPQNMFGTYLGDYIHLMTVDKDFYGVFSANNAPDPDHFPSSVKVTYQRNADFATKKLYALDGVTEVPISIDPFFFKADVEIRAALLRNVYQVSIDPLALLLPGDVYAKLAEAFHPHVPLVAEVQEAARGMTAEERAFVEARARAFGTHARLVEQAFTAEA